MIPFVEIIPLTPFIGIKFLTMENIFPYTTFIDVSMLITVHNMNDDINSDSLFIKNSISMETRTISSNGQKQVIYCTCKLKTLNSTAHFPFNDIYFLIEIDIPCDILIDDSRMDQLCTTDMEEIRVCDNHVIIWKCGHNLPYESLLKYMCIPYLTTILLQLSHTIKNDDVSGYGTWIGISSTFLLTDIALFFTVPETNQFTSVEKSLLLNLVIKILITIFAFYDIDVMLGERTIGHHQIDGVICIIASFLIIFFSFYMYRISIKPFKIVKKEIHTNLRALNGINI